MTIRALVAFLALALLAGWAGPALAHVDVELTAQTAWSDWEFTPDIVIPTLLVALTYGAGMARRGAVTTPPPWWRHALFFAGLAAVFLALESPVDPLAERLFFVHQIQHLLLRMIGPMLIALAWPEGILTAGLPAAIRRGVVAPIVGNGVVRAIFGVLTQPVVATVLFIAALYVWEIPRYHNTALLNEPIHYVMHVTMLFAGLVFWWRMFDRRPPPQGARFGVRLMMLWLALLTNIVLGAYTTLKSTALYGAYDVTGRLFGFQPLFDEKLGGIIIWIPGSMMCLAALLIVIHLWGRYEVRMDERGSAVLRPVSGSDMIEQQRRKNRALAVGFAAFAFTIFASALLVGVMSGLAGHIGAPTKAGDGVIHHMPASRRHAAMPPLGGTIPG